MNPRLMSLLSKLWNGFLLGFGYLLSPLSWWNDLVFNLPIAYGFAWVVTWGHRQWLVPGVILGYWLSNLVGILMTQWGARAALQGDRPRNLKQELLWGLGSATVYSGAIAALAYGHWLPLPEGLLP